jgi:transposase, IS5 family
MLRLSGGQVESLFDLGLPVEVRELPADLAALDVLLADPALLEPVERTWEETARGHGRPTIPIERFVRLMVIKQRSGWGYETLVREVSDSLHLRRFCRTALTERVPDESTVRKLVGRLGPDVIEEICRAVITNATSGQQRFVARAARIDSTVVEADIRYLSDLGLACDATKMLAREAAAGGDLAGPGAPRVQNRSRAVERRLRRLNRTLAARTGQGKSTAMRLTVEAGRLVERSIREARRAAGHLRARARGRGARAKLAAAGRLEELADRAGTVARQIRQREAGEKITNRLVSMSDPDARPIRKGKLRAPTEFGYVVQLAEVCENTRRGARGLIVPVASQIGSRNEPDLLPMTAAELERLKLKPRELALDGGFFPIGVAETLPGPDRVFIAARQSPGSRRTNRRLARFRVGIEGRISHLKRRYGLRRSRLKGHHRARTWTAWAILAYNLDTIAIRTP